MPATLGKYTLGRELGSGVSCKVKLAKDDANARYAIKILKQDSEFDELVKTEVDALKALDHEHIIKLFEVDEGVQSHPKKGTKNVKYIVLELAQGGELFDFVALGGALSEPQARYFFGQMMSGLKYCHDQGLVHRDLKPENIMLDKNYNVKIADFGFAAPVEGRDGSGMLETQLGTISYMAPEIHQGQKYDGKQVDIFAAAIILFVIMTQRPPFASAHPDDVHYQLVSAGGDNASMFWQAHAEANEEGQDIYSAEFKDMFESLMALNPSNRLSIDEIFSHPWMQGDVTSFEDIVNDFNERKRIVDDNAHNEREQKRKDRKGVAPKVRRAAGQEGDEVDETADPRTLWEELEIPEYDTDMQKATKFFTTGAPLDYMLALTNVLEAEKTEFTVSGTYLQVKYNTKLDPVPTEDDDEEEVKKDETTDEGVPVVCKIRVF
jgi:serine/threonine protein kinase